MTTRNFLPKNFELNAWQDVQPYFEELLNAPVRTKEELAIWLKKRSELDAFLSENMAWRYIKFTCNSLDKDAVANYEFFIQEIQPHLAGYDDKLNKKLFDSPAKKHFNEAAYQIFFRDIEYDIKLFREENIPLSTQISELAKEFNEISSAMTITYNKEEITLQQAAGYLESTDREVRKSVYNLVSQRRLEDAEKLDEIFNKQIELRTRVAKNAGYANFRDYMFDARKRFDYTIEQNLEFHEAIKKEIVPLTAILLEERKKLLKLDALKPFDLAVDPYGNKPLEPFKTGSELLAGSINIFDKTGKLGSYLKTMQEGGFLDLESRKGKAPGGYNYPLSETGIPFIFMNASGRLRDLVTLMHEGGHAVHSFLSRDKELVYFKHTPSEVAELASMSMELMTMDYWDEFFSKHELIRAKLTHLESVLEVLPWVAIIDKFQHWIYTHPEHSIEERDRQWLNIFNEFTPNITDYSGYEKALSKLWQKQMHLFEVPFYYIEYAIAQLGAISVWKNYKADKTKGLTQYLDALKLGYTDHMPEIYNTAGIKFNFGQEYIHELAAFVKAEIDELLNQV